MRKYVLLIMLMGGVSMAQAQLVKQTGAAQKTQAELDWYNCSYEEDGVYGAEVNKAYEFLKGKKLKKRPVVALIGTGMDVEHEDLKEAIWVNKNEKADGKDNDRNGLVDDVPLDKVRDFVLDFAQEMEMEHSDVMTEIESTGNLSGPAIEVIRSVLEDAKKRVSATWQA